MNSNNFLLKLVKNKIYANVFSNIDFLIITLFSLNIVKKESFKGNA